MKITICGSLAFKEQMLDVGKELKSSGHEILYPETVDTPSSNDQRTKHDLIKTHFQKIQEADSILVVNESKNGTENYIGGNTFLEMGVAFHLNKRIFILNNIPKLQYTEEIKSLKPIILNGDINTIK